MTDLEYRLHHAIGLAQSLVYEIKPESMELVSSRIESALRDAVEEIRELRAERERLRHLLSIKLECIESAEETERIRKELGLPSPAQAEEDQS